MGVPEYLSLGAGVQSSTLALMATHGEIGPMPKAAIFADTGDEPAPVYEWLRWLEGRLRFPVVRVQRGVISRDAVRVSRSRRTGLLYAKGIIPASVMKPDGGVGLLGRSCTRDYKIAPIEKFLRGDCRIGRGQKALGCVQWIGISTDEAHRMKPSRLAWSRHRWPLIEAGMSRADCLAWIASMGYPEPPRSACVHCPFRGAAEWRNLRDRDAAGFAKAVRFERELQKAVAEAGRLDGVPFLTRSGAPLDEVDFDATSSREQLELFGNECEGLCGV